MSVEVVVRSYFASFSDGVPVAIAGHVTDDFVNEHVAALGEGCVGRDAYFERLPTFLADMQALRYEIEDMVVEGERAMVTYTLRARWRGERSIVVRGAQRLVLREGLVAERTDYWDAADFLRQADPAAAEVLARFGVS